MLKLDNVTISYKNVPTVQNFNLDMKEGQIVSLVGESGSGKTTVIRAVLGLLAGGGKVTEGSITFEGEDLLSYTPEQWRKLRGSDISMIFQEPMTSLNPIIKCGKQIAESLRLHRGMKKKEAMEEAIRMMKAVGIANPEVRAHEYPHQMSGGQCQRAMIAIAMVNKPKILIADEPTTALDVTVQAQITDLMKHFQKEFNMSIIYITHDMGVIAEMADTIAVMYLGRVVESGSARAIFKNPIHPYTKGLLKSMPVLGNKSSERLHAIEGNVPVPLDPPDECGFCSRCQEKTAACAGSIPPLVEVEPDHLVRCFHYQGE